MNTGSHHEHIGTWTGSLGIWQGVGREPACRRQLCQAHHVRGHVLIPAGQQLLKLCVSFGGWPSAGCLIFLSLDFLIFEMAKCKGLVRGRSSAPSGPRWAQSQVQEALGKDFLPEKLHAPYMTPKLYPPACLHISF